jgi:hypothetical protein
VSGKKTPGVVGGDPSAAGDTDCRTARRWNSATAPGVEAAVPRVPSPAASRVSRPSSPSPASARLPLQLGSRSRRPPTAPRASGKGRSRAVVVVVVTRETTRRGSGGTSVAADVVVVVVRTTRRPSGRVSFATTSSMVVPSPSTVRTVVCFWHVDDGILDRGGGGGSVLIFAGGEG